jgi:hypothetical protein
MTSVLAQLRAILWKNLLIKWRHPVATTAEILLPVFFMSILIIIKTISSSTCAHTAARSLAC